MLFYPRKKFTLRMERSQLSCRFKAITNSITFNCSQFPHGKATHSHFVHVRAYQSVLRIKPVNDVPKQCVQDRGANMIANLF